MSDRTEKIRDKLLVTFREEAADHLQILSETFLILDRGGSSSQIQAALQSMFHVVHTFKGAARSVGRRDVEVLCEGYESMLSQLTQGRRRLSRPILHRIRETVQRLGHAVEGNLPVEEPQQPNKIEFGPTPMIDPPQPREASVGTGHKGPPEPVTAPPAVFERIRVSTEQLDALLRQAEELFTNRLAAEERIHDVQELLELLMSYRHKRGHAETRQLGDEGQGSGALEAALADLEKHTRLLLARIGNDHRALAHSVEGLVSGLRDVRMLPLASILNVFPRMVGDLGQQRHKQVQWVTQGAEQVVDRKILEVLKDPLIHLVRNAVDHGIEVPAKRRQAGKTPSGEVTLRASELEGGRLEICVQDDGAGVNTQAVREAAVRMRLLSPEAVTQLSDQQALDVIFRTGLSTSPVITDVSGHGLGLAIVKERVERLGGQVHIETQQGVGTTVRMTVPSSIAVFRGLLLEEAGQLFLVPTDSVERLLLVVPEEIGRVEGHEALHWNGETVPYARLSHILGLPTPAEEVSRKLACILMRVDGQRAAYGVTEALGYREAVVKELEFPLLRIPNIAAGGLLGSSEIALILRPSDLFRSLQRRSQPGMEPAVKQPPPMQQPMILVVDDSITTRTMEKNLLESSGFRVRVAIDGVEAWTIIKSESIDLVVSDVDMPRMDGFELTARVRADRQLADLPIVLVTALESREEKERGIDVGANAYVVKSSFDESRLLDIIHRLV